LPDVPAVLEAGLDEREWVAWYAFMAAMINQALQEAPIINRFRDLGASPRISTPAETLECIRAETADFGAMAWAGKIRVEQGCCLGAALFIGSASNGD
jgi:tripartite-type tricarboxylate transporter receptor subunit TctC